MNYLEFFNEKMKKALQANPKFAELDEKRKHYEFLRNDINENFHDLIRHFLRDSSQINFSAVSTFVSNTSQYLDQDYSDQVYNLELEISKWSGSSYAVEAQTRLKQLQDSVERKEAFLSKYDKESFFKHHLEEPNVISELAKIENAAVKQVLAENLNTQELSDYATAIVSEKELDINQFEYLDTFNNVLKNEYSKVKEDDYKLNRQVQNLFEAKLNDTEAEL